MPTAFRHIRHILLTLLTLTACADSFAASFKPIVTNFTSKDYGIDAGIQNWGIAQGQNGEIYIANNKGLLIFDGYTWSRVSTPGEIVIRSVFIDGDCIYIGSYEEFGYFKYGKTGKLSYTSLSNGLKGQILANEEIWNIVKRKGIIYFQSFNTFFAYDGKQLTVGEDLTKPLYFHQIGGDIYAQAIGEGYFRFDGKQYHEICGRETFGNDNIVAAVSLKSEGGKTRAILCSENNGLFEMSGSAVKKFPTEIDKELYTNRINRAVLTKDSTLVIGTILNGIYAIDLNGRVKWRYNVENGLNNNSVLRLFCDRDNNIWAALDNGIALIHSGAPYSIMVPDRGEPQIGMIYDLGIIGNRMLISSNQGVYSYSSGNGDLHFVEGTGGQNWHISTFGHQTFIGNNLHTLMIANGKMEEIPNTSSSSTGMRRCYINGNDVLLESTYSTLRIYRQERGEWKLSHTVDGFLAPIRQIEVDQSGTIWAANMNRGIYRIELSTDLTRVISNKYFKNLYDSVPSINYVMKIRGRIVFSDNQRLYTYDDISHKIIPYYQLNNALISTKNIHSATTVDNHTFWLSGEQEYTLVEHSRDTFNTIQHIPVNFFGLQNNESNDKVCVQNGIAYFNMNNGIARYDQENHKRRSWNAPDLTLRFASTTDQNGSEHRLPVASSENDIKAKNNISFRFSFPNYNKETVVFRFTLHGRSGLSDTKTVPEISYRNLGYGSYRLEAQAIGAKGEVISTASYAFTVERPFFLSTAAIITYLILLAAGIYSFSRWQTSRALTKKKKEYETERNKQNIKMLEQEKLIAQQQQQILETELSAKSKELASLALDVFAKEKVIENLKESMYTQKRKGNVSQKDMDILLKKIESDMSNLEFWSVYQKNFDLIHEHFFRNLRERYPQLTPGDLKFCALLRLNLSTKDIAKFANLSIRGVEAARYRLRKKFSLPGEVSLVEFLIDFK